MTRPARCVALCFVEGSFELVRPARNVGLLEDGGMTGGRNLMHGDAFSGKANAKLVSPDCKQLGPRACRLYQIRYSRGIIRALPSQGLNPFFRCPFQVTTNEPFSESNR